MLESTGGLTMSNPFFAAETTKFNAAQPQARRGFESTIAFGTPSPEEQQRYMEYLLSR